LSSIASFGTQMRSDWTWRTWCELCTNNFRLTHYQHVVWLYLRFTLSLRDVEDMLAERSLDLTYETVRRWVGKFGPLFARELRKRRPRPTARWHLDEMVVTIAGNRHWLWRAVDDKGEVLDILMQTRRDTRCSTAIWMIARIASSENVPEG